MLSIRLDISFVMLLILLSTVSLSLLKSNQASALPSVGAIVEGLKGAVGLFPGLVSAASQLGQITGITPKAPTSSDAGDLKQEVNQLRQELEMKYNNVSVQLAALNEQDRQSAKKQLGQTFKEAFSHYSAPEQSFLLNTTRELAPQLQNAVCAAIANGGPGGPVTTTNSGTLNCTGPHSCTWTSPGGPAIATSKC